MYSLQTTIFNLKKNDNNNKGICRTRGKAGNMKEWCQNISQPCSIHDQISQFYWNKSQGVITAKIACVFNIRTCQSVSYMKSIVKYDSLSSADNFTFSPLNATICQDGGEIRGGGKKPSSLGSPLIHLIVSHLKDYEAHMKQKKKKSLTSREDVTFRTWLTGFPFALLLHPSTGAGLRCRHQFRIRPVVFVTRYKTQALHTDNCTLARRDIRQPTHKEGGGHFYHRCRAGWSPATYGGLWVWSWAVRNTGQTRVSH